MPKIITHYIQPKGGEGFYAYEQKPYGKRIGEVKLGPMEVEKAETIAIRDEEPEEYSARVISDAVNNLMLDEKKLGELLARDHRTLVANKFRVLMSFVRALGSDYKEGNYDARNEAACRMASLIVDRMGEDLDNGIPRI